MEPAHHFSVAEANSLLPLLAERLPRLRRLAAEARDVRGEIEGLVAVGLTDEGVLIMAHDYKLAKQRFDRLRAALGTLLDDIHGLGVRVKDAAVGLVDFPAVLDGQDVLLCWRLGEPAVTFYHGYEDGYAGRRPIPPDTP